MQRLFLDANVLFTAAHNPAGKAAFVIDQSRRGGWELVTSSYAIAEARRNLEIKYPESLPRLDNRLAAFRVIDADRSRSCPLSLPEKDRPILLAALAAGATHLLTGDLRHFGPFMNSPGETAGMTIQTVADFLNNL